MSPIDFDVMVIEPDKNTYSESIFFKTKLFVSINNVTNSEPMRLHGLYKVKYSVTIHETYKHKAYVNMFLKGKVGTVLQPLWGQFTIVTESVEDTDTVTVDNTASSDFNVGDDVFVYKKYDEAYIATVAEIGDNYIKFTSNVTVEIGMFIIPAFYGYVKDIIKTSYSNEHYIKGDILIEELR